MSPANMVAISLKAKWWSKCSSTGWSGLTQRKDCSLWETISEADGDACVTATSNAWRRCPDVVLSYNVWGVCVGK